MAGFQCECLNDSWPRRLCPCLIYCKISLLSLRRKHHCCLSPFSSAQIGWCASYSRDRCFNLTSWSFIYRNNSMSLRLILQYGCTYGAQRHLPTACCIPSVTHVSTAHSSTPSRFHWFKCSVWHHSNHCLHVIATSVSACTYILNLF